MSLRTENLDDLVHRGKYLAELALEGPPGPVQDEARDLLSRIRAHEAIHDEFRGREV